jgi:hypothetical protein
MLRSTVYVMTALGLLWSAAAAVLAALAWRRVRWAAVATIICAGIAGGACLLMVIGSVLMLAPAAACVATMVLLLRPEARRWYAAGRR